MHSLPVSFELFILIMNFKLWSRHSAAALKLKQLIQLYWKSREPVTQHIFWNKMWIIFSVRKKVEKTVQTNTLQVKCSPCLKAKEEKDLLNAMWAC